MNRFVIEENDHFEIQDVFCKPDIPTKHWNTFQTERDFYEAIEQSLKGLNDNRDKGNEFNFNIAETKGRLAILKFITFV